MRKYRNLEQETKDKISRSMTGMKKSENHRKRLSDALKKYWETIPCKGGGNNEEG